ncbi:LysR substrate-binding domain-containing protein [Aestuariispira insulae]|uniref:Transcriptional regulator n=1 Tax=Aestuariispira insulae TaxID=1461337 RepID=A0A3D9HIC9_9PROT|nr:LysR substrate-binding domain-containing protein [Aestuariispira insulae]RED49194.1 transcriptional regulator [Aestuariispira insulae]
MSNLRTLLPSANSLFAFEAAARLLSFTNAARELNVTQAAVSHAIKRLEENMQVQLFHREYRKISLTDVGEKFYNDVAIGLSHIERSAREIRQVHGGSHVTFSITTAFAGYWMLPRLPNWRRDHPDVDLRLQTTDKDVDLAAEGITLGIRRGDGNWEGYESALLAEEEIYPVCSPDFLRHHPGLREPEDLLDSQLIIFEEAFRYRPGWAEWLREFGVEEAPPKERFPINDYATTLHAAIDGHGVAMGWHHLTTDLVKQGRLVRPIPHTVRTGMGFYVVWVKGRPLPNDAKLVRDWLLEEAGRA